MAYIVTRLCIDCLDKGCVEVCPVDCIYELEEPPNAERPNMLYIHPTECISCGACEPACPWHAIYEDREAPPLFQADIALNALAEQQPSLFHVAPPWRDSEGRLTPRKRPAPTEVVTNAKKWGLDK